MPGQEVLDQVLTAQRDGDTDEPGAGDREDEVDAETFQRPETADREDDDGDEVSEHASDGVGPLPLAGVGLSVVAEAVEADPPRPGRALGAPHGAPRQCPDRRPRGPRRHEGDREQDECFGGGSEPGDGGPGRHGEPWFFHYGCVTTHPDIGDDV